MGGEKKKKNPAVTKCAILAEAPPNLFERPLRHLQAASSIARSGPRAKSITLPAWNGWRRIPAPRPPLSKRNGGRRGDGEVSRDKQKSRPCMKDGGEGDGGQDDAGRNEEEDGSAELEGKKNWEECLFLLLSLSREAIMMLQLI